MPDSLLISIRKGEPITLDDILRLDVDINAFGATLRSTVLMAASFAGRADLVSELAKNGAVLDLGDQYGLTALHVAAGEGHAATVKILIEIGANIEAETIWGNTPLMVSAAWGNCEAVITLIELGANVHHQDNRGSSASMIAEEKGEEKVATILRAAESCRPEVM